MESLLIGTVLDGAFSLLNENLRTSTIEAARHRWGRVITRYSPWLSCAPSFDQIPSELIYFDPEARGALLRDRAVLASMSEFMGGPAKASIARLPGDPSTWLPSAEGISDVYPDAVSIIRNAAPVLSYLYDELVDYVVPLGGGRNRGFSTHLARGAIFRSLPGTDNAYDVAIDVVHEIGHQTLMVWQSVDPILVSDHAAPVFSQIRQTDRPAIQTYHATVALAFMRYLEVVMADSAGMRAAAERRGMAYTRSLSHSLGLSITSVRKACDVSELGGKLLDEMEVLI
jgi:hypothetical protein